MDAIVFEEEVSRASPRPQLCGVSEKLWMSSLEQLLYLVTYFKIIYMQYILGSEHQCPCMLNKTAPSGEHILPSCETISGQNSHWQPLKDNGCFVLVFPARNINAVQIGTIWLMDVTH